MLTIDLRSFKRPCKAASSIFEEEDSWAYRGSLAAHQNRYFSLPHVAR